MSPADRSGGAQLDAAPDADKRVEAETAQVAPAPLPANGGLIDLDTISREVRDGDLAKPMELTDFLFQLGLHLRLPERKEETLSDRVDAVVKAVRTRWWIPALALVLVGAIAARAVLHHPPPVSVPYELRGEWRTAAPRYAGRGFRIAETRLTLFLGDTAGAAGFPIVGVRRDSLSDTSRVELEYTSEHARMKFAFAYVETPRPTIYLSNPQGVVWLRPTDSGYDVAPAATTTAARDSARRR